MIDMRTDGTGYDLDLSSGGLVVGDDQVVARAVRTVIETFEGTYAWDLDFGIPWPDLLTRRGTGLEALVADQIRAEVSRVATCTGVEVELDSDTRIATITVWVEGVADPVTAAIGG